mgnify:CR=1 FL=1
MQPPDTPPDYAELHALSSFSFQRGASQPEELVQRAAALGYHALAITAANEHFTALFAEWMLGHTEWLEGTEARLQTLWLWHSAEESEHKSTAFDLYKALGGSERWRIKCRP